jgi:hypothetical protein
VKEEEGLVKEKDKMEVEVARKHLDKKQLIGSVGLGYTEKRRKAE